MPTEMPLPPARWEGGTQEEREAILAVEIPEQAGSLRKLCNVLAGKNLTEFSYRMAEGDRAQIIIGVQVFDLDDRTKLLTRLQSSGFACLDLSNDELTKGHLRHMVGGRLPASAKTLCRDGCRELLYRFEFPERPGALMTFVSALHPEWSISIFHYRNQGADVGRIVVGVLVNQGELEDWHNFLDDL